MKWFDIQNKTGADTGEIYIYGEITSEKWFDEDVTPGWFKDEVNKLKNMKYINMFINSGGGGVFAGMAIYSILKRQTAKITAHIDGIAASIASVIAMAAHEIIMPKNAMMMIHNPVSIALGDADSLRKEADVLDRVKQTIVSVYMDKTKKEEKRIRKMMDEQTWMDGESALKEGFIDTLETNKTVAMNMNSDRVIVNGVEFDIEKY
ncbi:MAG: Clp protease ClpP, partial [Methanosarcinaceae archaeon]|nr:Clp protease ClpP [Methanosarcinaceae archaeon]